MNQITRLRARAYDKAVDFTLRFYERYVLPRGEWWAEADKRVSLRELKVREFRDRRKLLNPYQKE